MLAKFLHFYRFRLASFFIFRLLKEILVEAYRMGYRLFSYLKTHPNSGKYNWTSLSSISGYASVVKQAALSDVAIFKSTPSFIGYASDFVTQDYLHSESSELEISIYELPSAFAIGGIDAQFFEKEIIHHDLYDPNKHTCPSENIGVISRQRQRNSIYLHLSKPSLHIENAVTLIGQCSKNYAHWLTETLPKLPVINSLPNYTDWPLLIDKDLHPNIFESLRLLNTTSRKIILVDKWQPIHSNRLVVISPPGYERYVPQGIMTTEPSTYFNKFSYSALTLLRTSLLQTVNSQYHVKTRRHYFSRGKKSSNLRAIINAEEIKDLLIRHEVTETRPEELSFQQQVNTCIDAELIIAPVGAALVNMIFAPPGCKIIVLAPYYENASYFYYANLAATLGHRLTYVLGPQVGNKRQAMHRDYYIDPKDLLSALI